MAKKPYAVSTSSCVYRLSASATVASPPATITFVPTLPTSFTDTREAMTMPNATGSTRRPVPRAE